MSLSDDELRALDGEPARPTITVLCGSTRFMDAFRAANLAETLAGHIVLTVGCDTKSDADLFSGRSAEDVTQIKANLDELHKRKIDLADEVLVLNVGGYIGDSTGSEIEYAEKLGRPIRYLEPLDGDLTECGYVSSTCPYCLNPVATPEHIERCQP